ncbi:hypothetical protein V3C99_012473 [Haemonchus contortus]|uniref:Ion_trans_2 domain-containing protein n=1 Tax=Haemonchus contortus TaxID=6289 RepID=A0A7I4Y583_HAECO
MVIDRLRDGTVRFVTGMREAKIRHWVPILLLFVLVVYLFMGSACFWFFEHHQHEQNVRKWYMNLAVNRRHFARSISSRIFNDTRNLLIIIDREQTERVQQLLVESLKRYEDRMELKTPDKKEWTFLNSFNYAYALLLTLGHGAKIPETISGQVFALIYCIFGVPLLFGTIAIIMAHCVIPLLSTRVVTRSRRLLLLQLVIVLYVAWNLCTAVFLYYQVFEDFWISIFTAFFTGMTIQIPAVAKISSCSLLTLLVGSTISAAIIILGFIVGAATYCPSIGVVKEIRTAVEEGNPPPKFTVIVDQAGESKLATATE